MLDRSWVGVGSVLGRGGIGAGSVFGRFSWSFGLAVCLFFDHLKPILGCHTQKNTRRLATLLTKPVRNGTGSALNARK